ncbi:GNAT family N-acetyltransferase [Nakamurella sp. A5-74]|uniref:GNAT family N-acetyltransferase n=1 Tax=Nakamurella sp. A5-74 TaxID=3158264 RepID=A0AAU8DK64_9ACTN
MIDGTGRELLADLGSGVRVERAAAQDVPRIVELLRADQLGAGREQDPGDPRYLAAFDDIAGDPRQLLTVLVQHGSVIGTMQLTTVPGLSRLGSTRVIIEAVRVSETTRGQGLGGRYLQWAIDRARTDGAALVQLTTDRSRADAHRFYERLGFEASHVGMKLRLR